MRQKLISLDLMNGDIKVGLLFEEKPKRGVRFNF